jgi:hypothetical protein
MLAERRRKLSELVGKPETQGERPPSRAAMHSVLGLPLSELVEMLCVFVSTPAVFGERLSTRGRTLHPIRPMPYSFGGASLSAPTAALRDRRDALEEARAAPSAEGDALREPRDALAIREDAVRRRGRDSRRVTRSSRSSPLARAISEAAMQARGAALPTQGDASRAPWNAVDETRDAPSSTLASGLTAPCRLRTGWNIRLAAPTSSKAP